MDSEIGMERRAPSGKSGLEAQQRIVLVRSHAAAKMVAAVTGLARRGLPPHHGRVVDLAENAQVCRRRRHLLDPHAPAPRLADAAAVTAVEPGEQSGLGPAEVNIDDVLLAPRGLLSLEQRQLM